MKAREYIEPLVRMRCYSQLDAVLLIYFQFGAASALNGTHARISTKYQLRM